MGKAVQAGEGVAGQAALPGTVQVAHPPDLDAQHPPLPRPSGSAASCGPGPASPRPRALHPTSPCPHVPHTSVPTSLCLHPTSLQPHIPMSPHPLSHVPKPVRPTSPHPKPHVPTSPPLCPHVSTSPRPMSPYPAPSCPHVPHPHVPTSHIPTSHVSATVSHVPTSPHPTSPCPNTPHPRVPTSHTPPPLSPCPTAHGGGQRGEVLPGEAHHVPQPQDGAEGLLLRVEPAAPQLPPAAGGRQVGPRGTRGGHGHQPAGLGGGTWPPRLSPRPQCCSLLKAEEREADAVLDEEGEVFGLQHDGSGGEKGVFLGCGGTDPYPPPPPSHTHTSMVSTSGGHQPWISQVRRVPL